MSGLRIHVCIHAHTVLFQDFRNRVTGKVLRPVESHVFQEMSQPILGIIFHERTHVLDDIKVSLTYWFVIFTNKIGQPIIQFSMFHVRVQGNRGVHFILSIRVKLDKSQQQ